jgi:hypothetical protein
MAYDMPVSRDYIRVPRLRPNPRPEQHKSKVYNMKIKRGALALLTRPDSGAGAGVLERAVVDGLCEERVAELVRSWERDTRRACGSRSGDLDLEAGHVWLGLASSGVQSNGFGADEIIARCERFGHNEGPLAAVGVQDLGPP